MGGASLKEGTQDDRDEWKADIPDLRMYRRPPTGTANDSASETLIAHPVRATELCVYATRGPVSDACMMPRVSRETCLRQVAIVTPSQ